ncbi:unnamed protein product [Effrenium voratum]|nr:unnamed protein product [Effrenium voratum]
MVGRTELRSVDDWPGWTVPFGWALNSGGPIKQRAPEFYWWRDICVWSKYMSLDPASRNFKGVFAADAAEIRWHVGYCKPCEILKCEPKSLHNTIKFDQLSKGFVARTGADPHATGLDKVFTEDDVVHTPTLPNFGKALAQEEAEYVVSALTAPYLRIPLLLHFFAADRLHALKQRSLQQLLWAALMEPATWADESHPPDIENAKGGWV